MAYNPSTYKISAPTISEIAKMAAKKNGHIITDFVEFDAEQGKSIYKFHCSKINTANFIEIKQGESLYAFCVRMGWLPEHKKGEVIKDYYSRIKDQYL
jgi:hypothetical protein